MSGGVVERLLRLALMAQLRRVKNGKVPAHNFIRPVAGQVFSSLVPTENVATGIQQENCAMVDCLEHEVRILLDAACLFCSQFVFVNIETGDKPFYESGVRRTERDRLGRMPPVKPVGDSFQTELNLE